MYNLINQIPEILEKSANLFSLFALIAIVGGLLGFFFYRKAERKDKNKAFISILFFLILLVLAALTAGIFSGFERGSEVIVSRVEQNPSSVNPQLVKLSQSATEKLEDYIKSQGDEITQENKAILLEEALEDYVNTWEPQNSKETTKPPKVKTVNRQLECVNNCDYNGIAVQVTVVSFTLDTNLNKTLMHLLLESQHNESGCYFGPSYYRGGLEFQDERTGKNYSNDRHSQFTLVARESRELIASYSFLPSPGSTYTLIPKNIKCDGHLTDYTPIYGDVPFTF